MRPFAKTSDAHQVVQKQHRPCKASVSMYAVNGFRKDFRINLNGFLNELRHAGLVGQE